MKRISFRIIPVLLLFLPIRPFAQAATIPVNTFKEGTVGDSLCSLAEAILAANGDTPVDGCNAGSGADLIILPPGVYSITDPSASLPSVTSDVTLESEGAKIERSGNALPFQILHVISGILTLRNIVISGGLIDPGSGGGILIEGGSRLTLIHSTVSNNQASQGGGIFCLSSTDDVTLIDSAVQNNTATALEGGGIDCGRITLVNSTVSGNQVTGSNGVGGGIFNGGDSLTVVNSTISDNQVTDASSSAGGLFYLLFGAFLKNTIIAGNTAATGPDCVFANPTVSSGNNLIGDASGCNLTASTGDQFNVDAGLDLFEDDGSPGNGHFPLLPASLAIDGGDETACPPEDQLGQPRLGICDMGAIESQESQTPLIVSPLTLNFESQVGVTSDPQVVTLTNSGNFPVTLSSIVLEGADPAFFSMANGCPAALDLRESCDLSLTFISDAEGDFSAMINIITPNLPSILVTLNGTAVASGGNEVVSGGGCDNIGTGAEADLLMGFFLLFPFGMGLLRARKT